MFSPLSQNQEQLPHLDCGSLASVCVSGLALKLIIHWDFAIDLITEDLNYLINF